MAWRNGLWKWTPYAQGKSSTLFGDAKDVPVFDESKGVFIALAPKNSVNILDTFIFR